MNALNNLKGTTDYVPKLFDNYENLKQKVDSMSNELKDKSVIIDILSNTIKEYTEKIIELRSICGFGHKYTNGVEGYLKVDREYALAHESNNPIVTLLRVKENTCIVEFSNGELKEVPIDFLKELKNN